MRARFPMLLVLATTLPLLAATCVTSTRQRGPVGPWVGEVVNTGDAPMRDISVQAHITDAAGHQWGLFVVNTCPSFLMPGERAAFELFFPTDINLDVTPPLRADFSPVAIGNPVDPNYPMPSDLTGEGLVARSIATYPDKRAALIEVRNNSAMTYSQLNVCGTIRTPAGTLAEVGNADLFPSVLHPGETATAPVFFNTMPDGVIDAFARGSTICCASPLSFEPSEFEVQNTRVVTSGGERQLIVAGEMRNRAGQDIGLVRLGAYAEGDPVTRVIADLACGAIVHAGETAAAVFSLPLDSGVSRPTPVITGVEAMAFVPPSYTLVASNIQTTPLPGGIDGLDAFTVTATLYNPTSKWVAAGSACATIRDRSGHVTGVGSLTVAIDRYILVAPHSSATATGTVATIGDAATTSVDCTAELRDQGPINIPGF